MMGVFWSFLLHRSFGGVFPLCQTPFLSLPKTLWLMFWLRAFCFVLFSVCTCRADFVEFKCGLDGISSSWIALGT